MRGAAIVAVFIGAASRAAAPEPAFTDLAPRLLSDVRLENSATSQKYLPETMAGGVALFDFDNDGRLDIFFTNGAALSDPMPAGAQPDKTLSKYRNRLFHQNPDRSFTDVTEKAGVAGSGYSMGVAVGDFDNDGYEDLFVTGLNSNTLYRNNGDGTFSDITARAGVVGNGWSTSAGFFDYNNDGRLDLFVARYLDWSFAGNKRCGPPSGERQYCHPNLFPGMTSLLYRNNGDGTFTDVSKESGIASLTGKGLGVAFADYDADGFTDIYVANDSVASFLLHNNGDGTFAEKGAGAGVAYTEDGKTFAGMGVDFSDFDNDGRPDLVATDLATQTYMLFRNSGKGVFSNDTGVSGLGRATATHSGWGVRWLDIDNDGWKDLFAAQGDTDSHMYGDSNRLTYRQKPLLLRNRGGRLEPFATGIGRETIGRGAAFGDLDNDGAIDIVSANIGDRPYLLHNNIGRSNNWLGIRTRGHTSNRDGIGCRITVTGASGHAQYFTVNTAGSYLSASDRRILAGLGKDASASIEAHWPGGIVQRVEHVKAGQWLALEEPAQ